MKLSRLLSGDGCKGEKNYLKNQREYEILKTAGLFVISAAVFLIGLFTTGSKMNLLTIVAILGCLPACKCLVELIMFIRYKSCDKQLADMFEAATGEKAYAFDRVFTSYDKNFVVDHLIVTGSSIIGYTHDSKFDESKFNEHIIKYLKAENIKDVTIKIFSDDKKYIERLNSLSDSESTEKDMNILGVLLSISL